MNASISSLSENTQSAECDSSKTGGRGRLKADDDAGADDDDADEDEEEEVVEDEDDADEALLLAALWRFECGTSSSSSSS